MSRVSQIVSSCYDIDIGSPQSKATVLSQTPDMSVLLETSAGDVTIDLFVTDAPKTCEK